MYFRMTYQHAKGFVGTRGGGGGGGGGNNVQKIVLCFPICSIQKGAVLAQNKAIHVSKWGPKSNMLKYETDSELTCAG